MIERPELFQKLKAYDLGADEDLFNRAFLYSRKAHATQVRASGEPYFLHPLEVAEILVDLRLDCYSVITGLLHDTVEDTLATRDDIEANFGPEIASLVDGVTKLSLLEIQSEQTKQAENFRKLVLAMSSDIRVLLVKLADRLHNMRTIYYITSEEKRKRIAAETLDIYAPLAERMGMNGLKDELEDLSFAQLHPDMHDSIRSRLEYLHQTSEDNIGIIINELKATLEQNGVTCTVVGREKRPYSIWRKMQLKNMTFEQLYDIMAFRIEVDSIQDCYQALGIIHSNYLMVPGRFKDYISTPKANNYKSIHTGVMGPENTKIEIQIRTFEMGRIAEIGVAAHWQYKRSESNSHDGKQYAWLRGLLEILDTAAGPEEFLEHTKLEMFQDQVFCFTPHGQLIALPKGATTIDFAYQIHSTVGNQTVGAKINNKQVPLRTTLQNGDQVEIITDKNHKPSPMWERFVVTGKARSAIRKFVRAQQRDQFLELGKNLLFKAFQKESLAFCEKILAKTTERLKTTNLEEIFVAVGEGRLSTREVLMASYPDHFKKEAPANVIEDFGVKPLKKSGHDHSISIKGLIPGMALHYAACCHPIPGDQIIGIVSTGIGVKIHTQDCETARYSVDPERIIELDWEDRRSIDERYIARLKVMFLDKPGALAATTTCISKQGANIVNFKVSNRNSEFWELLIDMQVKDKNHFNTIVAGLRAIKLIIFADRI
jgi:guanosine-3',5'-bis(diphosphate) 3'-pyrophosphohydrolase